MAGKSDTGDHRPHALEMLKSNQVHVSLSCQEEEPPEQKLITECQNLSTWYKK
jgi:hypothetical protein